jgi:hypothetical protein
LGSYYIDFIAPNGKRVRQSAGTSNKQQAQELHDKLKAQSWRVKNVGDKPRYSWQQAVVRWLSENDHKKSLRVDKDALRYFDQHLSGKMLDEITKSLVDEIKTHKKTTGVTNGTVNRNLAVLRSILIAAKNEWEWIDSYPKVKCELRAEISFSSQIKQLKISAFSFMPLVNSNPLIFN